MDFSFLRLPPAFLAAAIFSWAFAQSPEPPAQHGATLHSTTTLVQLSVVAHDAKGKVVTDLKKEDFEVFDNGTPQEIAVFGVEKAAPAPRAAPLKAFSEDKVQPAERSSGYAVILLDYLNAGWDNSAWARLEIRKMLNQFDPAGKIALYVLDRWGIKLIADFGTDRAEMLKKLDTAVGDGVCCSSERKCIPREETESCLLFRERSTQNVLNALADHLSFRAGRKALIWVTTGTNAANGLDYNASFLEDETKRVMRKLNNADVALYPVDSCGLVTPAPLASGLGMDPCYANHFIMEDWAARTGGALVYRGNDLDVALREAAEEVRFTYSLAFYPPQDGVRTDFHQLKVEVRRPGIKLEYKQGYSLEEPATATAATLMPPIPGTEARAAAVASLIAPKSPETMPPGASAANIAASMALPYFYTAPNVALVDLAMETGTADLKFRTVDGKQHVELSLDAVASRPDGGVAGRFSDTVKLDFATEAAAAAFRKQPYRYEHQFRLAPGLYNVRVAFRFGEEAGKVEMPLTIDGWDGQHLALSGIALARESRRLADAASGLDSASIEGRKALIARSTEIIPAGSSRFRRSEPCLAFIEIYEPLLAKPDPPKLSVQIRVLDRQTGEYKADSGSFGVDNLVRAGDQVVPVSLTVPIATLSPGSYRLEVKAMRSPGVASAIRLVDFDVE